MSKTDYTLWNKNELIDQIQKLEGRKKFGLVWDEERTKEIFELNALNGLPILQEIPENSLYSSISCLTL